MVRYIDILKLVWPLALGMINSALMQFVDRTYLAHDAMSSLEAVLPATALVWVFMCFFQSVVGYAGVFVAQYHGAGDEVKVRESYHAGMVIAIVSGLLMFAFLPLGEFIFSMTANSEEIVVKECEYYDIAMLGGIFVYGQMACASYFTGRGNTRIVFWVSLLGNILNVALDPLLIFGYWGVPRLGITGAAYATVASMAVQFVILAVAAHREKRKQVLSERPKTFDRSLALRILRFGIPSGGYEVLNMASFTIFVFVTGTLTPIAFAASNACFTVNYLIFAPMTGFALGVQTLVGQSLGRGDTRGAFVALRRTMVLALSFVVVACATVLCMSDWIMGLFASEVPVESIGEFKALGFTLLCLMSTWMLFDAADVILSGALKGAGDTRFVFWWMMFCAFVLWIPSVFVVLAIKKDMPLLWSTMVVYVIITVIGSFWRWHRGKWCAIHLLDKNG